ncbi:hypothetical protein HYH02_010444 [Chlamydomonas schloesseri]|uniref:Uncharacterized protein n=1 Tax=Chlamydomonas schloesseri TaxID=2026947 RepID=A0A835T6N7_9CHLO|nr:hypothetical protein HYH02_010444 [Chlamydomonas schloesseri]|eukprot:KAG2439809.1 hypothetical protein HYH02_010444 [Chlamydomonas schloesseri]
MDIDKIRAVAASIRSVDEAIRSSIAASTAGAIASYPRKDAPHYDRSPGAPAGAATAPKITGRSQGVEKVSGGRTPPAPGVNGPGAPPAAGSAASGGRRRASGVPSDGAAGTAGSASRLTHERLQQYAAAHAALTAASRPAGPRAVGGGAAQQLRKRVTAGLVPPAAAAAAVAAAAGGLMPSPPPPQAFSSVAAGPAAGAPLFTRSVSAMAPMAAAAAAAANGPRHALTTPGLGAAGPTVGARPGTSSRRPASPGVVQLRSSYPPPQHFLPPQQPHAQPPPQPLALQGQQGGVRGGGGAAAGLLLSPHQPWGGAPPPERAFGPRAAEYPSRTAGPGSMVGEPPQRLVARGPPPQRPQPAQHQQHQHQQYGGQQRHQPLSDRGVGAPGVHGGQSPGRLLPPQQQQQQQQTSVFAVPRPLQQPHPQQPYGTAAGAGAAGAPQGLVSGAAAAATGALEAQQPVLLTQEHQGHQLQPQPADPWQALHPPQLTHSPSPPSRGGASPGGRRAPAAAGDGMGAGQQPQQRPRVVVVGLRDVAPDKLPGGPGAVLGRQVQYEGEGEDDDAGTHASWWQSGGDSEASYPMTAVTDRHVRGPGGGGGGGGEDELTPSEAAAWEARVQELEAEMRAEREARQQYEAELSRLAAAAGMKPGQLLRLAGAGGSSSLAGNSRTAAGLRAAVAAAAASVAGGGGRSAAIAAAAAAAAAATGLGSGGSSPARGTGAGRAGVGSRVTATARALAGVGVSPARPHEGPTAPQASLATSTVPAPTSVAATTTRRSLALGGLLLLLAPAQAQAYGGRKQLESMDAGGGNPRYAALQKIVEARRAGVEAPEAGPMDAVKEQPKKRAMKKTFT